MAIEFMCRKIGMTQLFNEAGECIPVTVLDAQPNRVVQKKTPERDGYSALQLGYGERAAAPREQAAPGALREGVGAAREGSCARAGSPPRSSRSTRSARRSASTSSARASAST